MMRKVAGVAIVMLVSSRWTTTASESFTARRTESVDAPDIAALVKRSTEAVFGRINVEYVM